MTKKTELKQKLQWGLVIFTFLCMLVYGFLESLNGPAVPAMVAQFGVGYTAIATMMLLCTVGYLVGTMVGGVAADRVGFKPVFVTAYLLVIVSALSMRFTTNFSLVMVLMVVMRLGLGLFETGVNSLGAKIFIRASANMMNMMHLFFGIGSIGGTQLMGQMLSKGFAWYNAFTAAGIVVVAGLAVTLFVRFPQPEREGKVHLQHPVKVVASYLKDKILWILVFALACSEMIELGTGGWLVNFLETEQGLNHADAAFYLSMFFVFFSMARLLAGWIPEKIGYLRFLIIAGFLTSVLFFAGFLSAGEMNIFFSLSGAPVAVLFPTIMAIIMKQYKTNTSTVMGIIIACAGFIFMLINQSIGVIADHAGVRLSFMIIGLFGVLSALFLLLAKRMIGKELK